MASMLPTSWWLFWWSVGITATVVLLVWFLRAARRADAHAPEAQDGAGERAPHGAERGADRTNG